MSDISEKLFWQIGQHSSRGIRELQPEHQNTVSYLIHTFQPPNTVEKAVTLAIVAQPAFPTNRSNSKEISQIVVDTIAEVVANGQAKTLPDRLALGFDLANQRIHNDDLDKLQPIVCTAAAIVGQQLYVTSCGHCRVFLVRDGIVRQLSVAHTMPEMLIEAGAVTVEEFMTHPYSGPGLVRFLGLGTDSGNGDLRLKVKSEDVGMVITADHALSLRVNDIILVCSALFGSFLIPDDWQLLTEYFGQPDKDIQSLVDNYTAAARPMEHYLSRDITILALRLVNSNPVFPP